MRAQSGHSLFKNHGTVKKYTLEYLDGVDNNREHGFDFYFLPAKLSSGAKLSTGAQQCGPAPGQQRAAAASRTNKNDPRRGHL